MKKIILITLIILKSVVQTNAQTPKPDSLFTLLKTAKHDTTRIKLYLNIGDVYEHEKPDTAIFFYQKALNLAEKTTQNLQGFKNLGGLEARFLSLQATSLNYIGIIHKSKGDYDKAIEFYFKGLKICEELGDKKGMSASYNNIGIIHANKGDYDKAIEFYFKSLKILEELGDKKGMSVSYNNIGIIHADKGDYDKAIDFYFKSLKIYEELGDKNGMSTSYNNIGNIHSDKGDYDKAIDFYFKSLKICEELGDKKGMSGSYTNIGSLYLKQNKPKEAKQQQLLALNIATEIGAKELMYYAYSSLAQCDSALANFRGAYEYHKLYSQVHDSVFTKESNDKIAEMGAKYEAEKRELTIQKLEKEKLLQNETLARKEAESKKQRILLFSFLAGFIIILVFSVFLYRLFVQKKMANVILEQQKEEISAQRDEIETQRDLVTYQKEHIEEIHKEVTDSINYAKRIQEAMLPALSTNLTGFENLSGFSNLETFILFKPKDVVSGDFYWSSRVNEYQIYAVADCTGHGVPGAFMSMLGISFLNEIVRKKEVTQASHVLDQLRVSIIDALKQTGGAGTQKDGMDMSLVVIKNQEPSSKSQIPNSKNQENEEQLNIRTIEQSNQEQQTSNSKLQTSNFFNAQWAGANNPLWVVRGVTQSSGLLSNEPEVRDTVTQSSGLLSNEPEVRDTDFPNLENLEEHTSQRLVLQEVKPDKMPIAIYEKMNKFTNHEITLCSGDIIYLMSDGYEDQFGGEKGKKFLSKNLKELIIANCLLTMEEQKLVLENTLVEWIGNGEQIDDITLLGIRI